MNDQEWREHADEIARREHHENGWPYGIDPNTFREEWQYERALNHHRQMAHFDILNEKHEDWRIEQQRIIEKTRYHDARNKDREWWMEPICAFFSLTGGALSLAFWLYCIASIFIWIGSWQIKNDAQWCLKDIAACERNAGPDFKIPGKDDRK